MNDVVYLLLTLACFGLLALLVGLIDRHLTAPGGLDGAADDQ